MTDYPYDLGHHSWPVSTSSPEAQTWFDRGLAWVYGFNHEEAVICFQRASAADPSLAMAYWGIAYATGPNYNMPWELFDKASQATALATARQATEAALALIEGASPLERALVEALPARFPQAELSDLGTMATWDRDFADAMLAVQLSFPDALEARAFAVEALMQLTPWKMWEPDSGAPADGSEAVQARALLETAFTKDQAAWSHPGLLHLYVHLMEMHLEPELALPQADRLRNLVPDAGHLVHMATHIDVQCGAYADVVHWNEQAIAADLKYFEREGAMNLYSGYRAHDYHFVIYGAMMAGQIQPALRAEEGLRQTLPEEMLRIESPPMADFYEAFLSFAPHILVRFGRWREASELTAPKDTALYASLTATTHYARALGLAALGEVTAARAAQEDFRQAHRALPEGRLLHNNTMADILAVGDAMLEGEILYREGAQAAAFDQLRLAVAREEALNFDEPWGWMQPVRHALGALLLEQGHLEEAAEVFRTDLGLTGGCRRAMMHPDNVWALTGLAECLERLGATDELGHIRQRLSYAQARADQTVKAACGCAGLGSAKL
ncbi:MAG: hypothetical protein AAFQ06_01280 [Pseudomonadota bacterium]